MPALVAGIQSSVLRDPKDVDGRNESGHDELVVQLFGELRRFGAGIGGFANRGADEFGAAAAACKNGVFHLGGDRATAVIGHPSCANGARHHQRWQTRGGHSRLMAHPVPGGEDDNYVNYWSVWFQSQVKIVQRTPTWCNAVSFLGITL